MENLKGTPVGSVCSQERQGWDLGGWGGGWWVNVLSLPSLFDLCLFRLLLKL